MDRNTSAEEVDTGSTSVHVNKDPDIKIIRKLGWENIGVSKILTRSLAYTEKYFQLLEEKESEWEKSEQELQKERRKWNQLERDI